MKLINKDITYVASGDELEEVLGPVYRNERKYQGSKQHMRLRWNRGKSPIIEWWSDLGHSRNEIYRIVDGFIRKRIGKKADEVYSEFLKDPRFSDSKMNWSTTPRQIFQDYVSTHVKYRRRISTWRDTYIVDSDDRIQLNPDRWRRKRNRNLVIRRPYSEEDVRYYIDHKNVERLKEILIECFGLRKYLMLVSNEFLTAKQYSRNFKDQLEFGYKYPEIIYDYAMNISALRAGHKYGKYIPRYIDKSTTVKRWLFAERCFSKVEYIRGTKEYFIKRAELKRQKRLNRKLRKHPDRENFDRTLWAHSQPSLNLYWKHPESYDFKIRGKSIIILAKDDKTGSKQEDIGYSEGSTL